MNNGAPIIERGPAPGWQGGGGAGSGVSGDHDNAASRDAGAREPVAVVQGSPELAGPARPHPAGRMISPTPAGKSKAMQKRIALVVPAVLAAALAGCGSAHPAAASIPAAAAATAATSSRVSVAVTTGSPGMSLTFSGAGAFDYAHSRGWLRLGGAGFALEERFVPPRMYVKLPGGIPDTHGKLWLSAPVEGAGAGRNLPLMFPGPQASPADLLALVANASGSVHNLGITTTINGVRVTQYQDSLDIARAISRARPAAQGRLRGLAALLGATRIPAGVWLDGKGLVRRIQVKLAVPPVKPGQPTASPGGSGYSLAETVTYSDFGVPVQVTAPPAAQVVDISSVGSAISSIAGMAGHGGTGSSGSPAP